MTNIIGLRELRENVAAYAAQVAKGKSFVVVKQSKPLFKISPVDEDESWETVVDFTKIKKGGVRVEDIVAAIRNGQNTKSSRKASKPV
jgi:antitoxin (DNA-binding transcriptional repressor) of toxin-antitoxin stability system